MPDSQDVPPLADPYFGAMEQAKKAGGLFEQIHNDPEGAAKLGIGVAGMRREPLPEPEPLSKSIQGPLELSHVMDAIGRAEEQNRQILEILNRDSPARF